MKASGAVVAATVAVTVLALCGAADAAAAAADAAQANASLRQWGAAVTLGDGSAGAQQRHRGTRFASSPAVLLRGGESRVRHGRFRSIRDAVETAAAGPVGGPSLRKEQEEEQGQEQRQRVWGFPRGGGGTGGRMTDLRVRVESAVALIAMFLLCIVGGRQSGCALLVFMLQMSIFKEGMGTLVEEEKESSLKKAGQGCSRLFKWAIVAVFAMYAYGSELITEAAGASFEAESGMPSPLRLFSKYHLPGVAAAYIGVFCTFIRTLSNSDTLAYQLANFAVAHFASFLVLCATLSLSAMRAGLIWFVLPSALVIINDILAYFCGNIWGKTPLISLSPKKTREGYWGAAVGTVLTSLLATRLLSGVAWMTQPGNIFLRGHAPAIGAPDSDWLYARGAGQGLSLLSGRVSLSWADVHGMGLAVIASIVGPYGGFLASAVKRATGVKDYGNTIPGHGGAADRFDCQLIVLPLTFFYMKAFMSDSLPI